MISKNIEHVEVGRGDDATFGLILPKGSANLMSSNPLYFVLSLLLLTATRKSPFDIFPPILTSQFHQVSSIALKLLVRQAFWQILTIPSEDSILEVPNFIGNFSVLMNVQILMLGGKK